MRNRFDKYVSLRSTYQPQQYVPNFQLLAQALQQQQGRYDQMLEAGSKNPNFIRESQLASQQAEEYRNTQQERIERAKQAYMQGIQQGNQARKEILLDIQRDYQPGGIANRLENDYNLYSEYRTNLNKNDKVNANIKQAALQRSLDNYEKGFGSESPFSGYQTQNYVDAQKKLDDLAKGFEAEVREGSAVINGRRIGKTMNGQYYYLDTNKEEFVRDSDVRNYVMQMGMTDPEMLSHFQQEDDLIGGEYDYTYLDEEGNKKTAKLSRSQYQLNTIADSLASKYGFMRQTTKTQLKDDWVAKQNRKFAHDRKMKEEDDFGHRASLLLKQDSGIPKLTSASWKKSEAQSEVDKQIQAYKSAGISVKDLKGSERENYENLLRERSRLNNLSDNKQTAARDFVNWLETPEGKDKYPNMMSYLSKVPMRDKDGNARTIDQRLELASNNYNAVLDDVNTRVMRGRKLSPDGRKKENYIMLGDGTYGGELQDYTLYPYDDNTHEIGSATNLKTILDQNKITEEKWKEIKKNFTATQQLDPDSPGIPGGILMTGFIPNDKEENVPIRFIVSQPDVETENYFDRYSPLYKGVNNPFKDHGYGPGFGEPVGITAPNGEQQGIIIKADPQMDSEGNYTGMINKTVYSFDPETGISAQPSSLTFNEVSQFIDNSNAFRRK